jgi:hypothetical protein
MNRAAYFSTEAYQAFHKFNTAQLKHNINQALHSPEDSCCGA